MQIGTFKLSTPMAVLAVALVGCTGCCAMSLVVGGVSEATRSPADKTATVTARSFTAPARVTSVPATVPAATVGTVGVPQSSGGLELTATKVETAQRGPLGAPKAGNVFVNVLVSIANTERDTAPYNPLYFKVKDSGGFEYTGSLVGPDPSLKSGELAKGERAAGWVTFEVPAEASGLVLSYKPLVLFGGYQPIQVDLGR